MSLRQKLMLENLPKCNNNIEKAGIMSGYSKNYAHTKLYGKVRDGKIAGIKSEESVKQSYLREIKRAKKIMLSNKDNTNYLRSLEIEGKVKGLFKDAVSSNTQSTIVIDRQGLTSVPNDTVQPIDTNTVKPINDTVHSIANDTVNDMSKVDTPTPPMEEGK
jgi:hypothetical protein